jgi:hypothetical protein
VDWRDEQRDSRQHRAEYPGTRFIDVAVCGAENP